MQRLRLPLIICLSLLVFPLLALPVRGYGNSVAGTAIDAPTCNNSAPSMVWPFWARSAGGGAVDLTWGAVNQATSWTVSYGVAPGKYIYGVSNFGDGNSRSFRISALPSGVYYFVMRANNGCKPGPFSNEWKVTVGRGGVARTQSVNDSFVNAPAGSPKNLVPTVSPSKPAPAQAAQVAPAAPKTGFWQKIVNFFLGK